MNERMNDHLPMHTLSSTVVIGALLSSCPVHVEWGRAR